MDGYITALGACADGGKARSLCSKTRAGCRDEDSRKRALDAGAADALDDLQCERWSEHRAYSLSKLCCAMIAMELDAEVRDAASFIKTFPNFKVASPPSS